MTNTDKYAELRSAVADYTDDPYFDPYLWMSTGKCYEWLGRLLADLDVANQLLQKVVDDTEIGCVPLSHLNRIEAYLSNPPTDKEQG